jgi:dUTP pyrophosphatase
MDDSLRVGIHYLKSHEGLPPIERQTPGSSGFDLHAACAGEILVAPGEAALVPAGFQLSIPEGYEAQVRPRSGLAIRSRIGLLNSPGTVDSDYRGEICVIIYNFGEAEFVVRRGDRIAQLVITRLPRVELVEQDALDETGRGSGGFGHTG